MKINSREDILDLINYCEQNFPVQKWNIQGIKIWPSVRINLFFKIIYLKEKIQSSGAQQKTKSRLKHYLFRISALLYYLKFRIVYRSGQKQSSTIYLGANSHRVDLEGKKINRFFDPLIDIEENFNSNTKCKHLLFEYNNEISTGAFYKKERVYDSKRLFYGFFTFRPKLKITSQELEGFELFERYVNDMFEKPVITKSDIIQKALTYLKYSTFYNWALKWVKAKQLVALCYYNDEPMGAINAAHKLGIESVDMQHGPQSDIHAAYGRWITLSESGSYNLLPDKFWCWDQKSADIVNKSFPHQPAIVKGNTWLEAWKNGIFSYDYNKWSDKKVLLLSLQPLAEPIPDWLIQLIIETQDIYQWMIRFHPRMSAESISNIHKAFENVRVEVDEATEMPMPYLLSHTDIHITNFSGTIIEADLLNIPSIITDPIGMRTFEHLINSGRAFYQPKFDNDFLQEVLSNRNET